MRLHLSRKKDPALIQSFFHKIFKKHCDLCFLKVWSQNGTLFYKSVPFRDQPCKRLQWQTLVNKNSLKKKEPSQTLNRIVNHVKQTCHGQKNKFDQLSIHTILSFLGIQLSYFVNKTKYSNILNINMRYFLIEQGFLFFSLHDGS